MVRRREISPRKVRTGDWGDRQRSRPVYIPVNRRVVTQADIEATKREIAAGWRPVTPVPPPVDYVHECLKLVGLVAVLMFGIWFVATFIA